jgi:hypothetical protein
VVVCSAWFPAKPVEIEEVLRELCEFYPRGLTNPTKNICVAF